MQNSTQTDEDNFIDIVPRIMQSSITMHQVSWLLTCIHQMLGSDLGQETNYPEIFMVFLISFR
jgi:hypothetical protein